MGSVVSNSSENAYQEVISPVKKIRKRRTSRSSIDLDKSSSPKEFNKLGESLMFMKSFSMVKLKK